MVIKQSTKIKYRVPAWEQCNCMAHGKPVSNQACRFAQCDVVTGQWVCVLYDEPLNIGGKIERSKIPNIYKVGQCRKSSARFKQDVEYDEYDFMSNIDETNDIDLALVLDSYNKEVEHACNILSMNWKQAKQLAMHTILSRYNS